MNKKRAFVNLYKVIVSVTRVPIFCTTLFTNNNIKVGIQIDAFLAHSPNLPDLGPSCYSFILSLIYELEITIGKNPPTGDHKYIVKCFLKAARSDNFEGPRYWLMEILLHWFWLD